MFSKRLNYIHDLPQTLLDKLHTDTYSKPGGWNIKDDVVNEFKSTMKSKLHENQEGRCAYCELPLKTRNPEIEHIAYKGGETRKGYYKVMFSPENLVYACRNCNSPECKGQKNVVRDTNGSDDCKKWSYTIVHPYFDNPTHFFYIEGGIPRIKNGLDDISNSKAKLTIEMFGLNEEKCDELEKDTLYETLKKENPDLLAKILKISSYK